MFDLRFSVVPLLQWARLRMEGQPTTAHRLLVGGRLVNASTSRRRQGGTFTTAGGRSISTTGGGPITIANSGVRSGRQWSSWCSRRGG